MAFVMLRGFTGDANRPAPRRGMPSLFSFRVVASATAKEETITADFLSKHFAWSGEICQPLAAAGSACRR
jgi:hypothetical protein